MSDSVLPGRGIPLSYAHLIHLRSILILSSELRLCFAVDHGLSDFEPKLDMQFFVLYFVAVTIYGERYAVMFVHITIS
jgi:hypothetical protein